MAAPIIIAGLAVVSLGGMVGSFIFSKKRKKYKKKNQKLKEEIENYENLLNDLDNYERDRRNQIVKEKFFVLKAQLLNEIDLMYKEKLKIKEEIEGLLNTIKKELHNPKLNNFYKEENYKSYNLLMYGLEKINAYFRYLNYFKYQISKFEKKGQYWLLFQLPKIESFLPDEYLFKGVLLEVDINEFNKYNTFSQRLILNPLEEKYLKDKNLVLIEEFDFDKKVFIGSISKGELAFYYKNNSFLEAISMENENRNFINLKYKNSELILNKNEKQLNRRITKGERLQVRIKSSNYLLSKVYVTEKDEENNYTLFVVGNKFKNISIIDIDEKGITFYSEGKVIITEFRDKYAEIIKIEERNVLEVLETIIEIKFVTKQEFEVLSDLITKKEFKEVKDYLLLSYSARKSDNKFFTKYIDLLNYQIENNQYQIYYKTYKIYSVEDNEYILKVNLDFDIEKNAYIEINDKQYLLKDYSKEKNFIKIDAINEIPQKGNVIIYSYSYPYALIQQRKALNKFMFDQIVNKNIKNIFLNPNQKKYSPIFENIEIEFKNKHLTLNQQEIVKKALNERDLFLIQGPPGTGKTTIIKEIIYQSKKMKLANNILVVSQQNVAVDNVLVGLKKESIDKSLLRISSNENKVYESLLSDITEYKFKEYKAVLKDELSIDESHIKRAYRQFWYELIKNKEFKEIDETIKEYFVKNHNIIGATCVGLANERMGLEFSDFDLVIIDEAGRANLGELLIPILKAKKVILIGDHKQLPPSTDKKLFEKIEKDEGFSKEDLKILEKSYFEELYENLDSSSKAMLNEQFRMPNKIGTLISEIFYEGKLKNGRDVDIKDALNWIDIKGFEKIEGTSKSNKQESQKIAELVNHFRDKSIAIITPYAAQKRLLRRFIQGNNIKIDTIDSFQGEEAEIVFYSLVRNRGSIQFLLDMRRLNVAISRTQKKLFFVGNKKFFAKDKLFRNIIEKI